MDSLLSYINILKFIKIYINFNIFFKEDLLKILIFIAFSHKPIFLQLSSEISEI